MSSYVSFWVKNKDGAFTRLCDFSRSSEIYQACYNNGVKGKVVKNEKDPYWPTTYAEPYTKEKADAVIKTIEEKIKSHKKYIENYNKKIELIKDMKDTSIEDRLDYINDYENSIKEIEEDLDCTETEYNYLNFIEIIRDTIAPYKATKEERDTVIWAGIDCSIEGEKDEE